MTTKKKRGRPPGRIPPASRKSRIVSAKFTPSEYDELDAARNEAGLTWRDFILSRCLHFRRLAETLNEGR